jgi:hypothetical protein
MVSGLKSGWIKYLKNERTCGRKQLSLTYDFGCGKCGFSELRKSITIHRAK